MEQFFRWEGNRLILKLLICANTKINKIGKPKANQLKINISAQPQSGKATEFLLKFLAKELKIKNNEIELISGQFNPNKVIEIKNAVSNKKLLDKLGIKNNQDE